MGVAQVTYDYDFDPVRMLGEWMSVVGYSDGLKLPDPITGGECNAMGGYRGGLWINFEVWARPDGASVARFSARREPFGQKEVQDALRALAGLLEPKPRAAPSPEAFSSEAFTWVGDYGWTVDDPAEMGRTPRIDEMRAIAPRGLCGFDGRQLAHPSEGCQWAFVDAPRGVAYLGWDYLSRRDGQYETALVDGRGAVPLTSVPGVSILASGVETFSAAISPDGQTLATIQYNRGPGYVTLIDVQTGRSRPLSSIAHAAGNESLSFSPCGRWLLIGSTTNNVGAIIVDVATGARRELTSIVRTACWWVRDGHLGLLEFGHGDNHSAEFDPTRVTFHDLATGESIEHARLRFPDYGLDKEFQSVFFAEPNSTGRVLLEHFGPPPNANYSVTGQLSMVDLETGEFTTVLEPFADSGRFIRRDPRKWKWNSPLALQVTASSSVLDGGFEPIDVTQRQALNDGAGAVLRVEIDSPFFTG